MSEISAIEHTQRIVDATGKLKIGEPLFILRAQDATAGLLLEAWVAVQQLMRAELAEGRSLTEAVANARVYLGIPDIETLREAGEVTEKELGALAIAKEMRNWPNRKLAD